MPDEKRQQLRDELLAGADSKPAKPANQRYFASLRERVRHSRQSPAPSN